MHEEVLKAEDVPEEEMVSMVWHDQGDSADAADAEAVARRPQRQKRLQNKMPRSRRLGNARP